MSTTLELENEILSTVPTGLLINGEWRPAASGKTFGVEDPATGKVLLSIADAGPEDGRAALDAAAAAQESWAKVLARERGEILRRAFEMVTARAEDFAPSQLFAPLAGDLGVLEAWPVEGKAHAKAFLRAPRK